MWPEPVKKNLEAPDLVDTQNQAVIEALREGPDALAVLERASIKIAIVGSVSTTPTKRLERNRIIMIDQETLRRIDEAFEAKFGEERTGIQDRISRLRAGRIEAQDLPHIHEHGDIKTFIHHLQGGDNGVRIASIMWQNLIKDFSHMAVCSSQPNENAGVDLILERIGALEAWRVKLESPANPTLPAYFTQGKVPVVSKHELPVTSCACGRKSTHYNLVGGKCSICLQETHSQTRGADPVEAPKMEAYPVYLDPCDGTPIQIYSLFSTFKRAKEYAELKNIEIEDVEIWAEDSAYTICQ